MAVVTNCVFLDILLALLPVIYMVYWILTNNNDYWDKKGVPNVKKGLLIKAMLGTQSQADAIMELYNQFCHEKFVGFFQVKKPVLMVRNLDLINKMLVKDFIHFQDRGNPQTKNDPLSLSLFNLRGHIWRALRYKLTPTFTTGKLKLMFDQISKSGDNMMEKIEELIKENHDIESKPFLFEFTLDVISSCAFGLQVKPNSPDFNTFKITVQKMFSPSWNTILKFAIMLTYPKLAEFLDIKSFPRDISDYFLDLTSTNMKYRKDNNIYRNDYFQLLLTLKEQEDSGKEIVLTPSDATEDDAVIDQMRYTETHDQISAVNVKVMTEESISANSFIFLIAGSESTANAISFTLLNLAQHLHIQQRLQQEVDSVLQQRGGWSYDAIKDMTYLDQVVQESQRIYPLLPMLIRECVLPYKVPDTDIVIEKGTLIAIPVMGLHRDSQYYPEPDRFNPDRFEGNNFKPNSTFLPFGDGPRICIAMRFAVMEIKACLAKIMSKYTVKLSPKTQLPIKLNKRSFFPAVEGGIWLTFEKRKLTT